VLEAVEGTSTHEIGRELDPTATKAHIDAFVETDNMDAEPFVQTKSKVHRRRIKWPVSATYDSGCWPAGDSQALRAPD